MSATLNPPREHRDMDDEDAASPDMDHADRLKRWIASPNIAMEEINGEPEFGETKLQSLADRVKREFTIDDESRAGWKDKYKKWLEFAMQVTQPKTYPWVGASNVIYPLITTAAIQFAARAYPAIVRDREVVKGVVLGDDRGVPAPQHATQGQPPQQPPGPPPQDGQQLPQRWLIPPGAKRHRADEIGRHMSWQLLDEMKEWEDQTDRLLLVLPIVGTMFRKSYFDRSMQRNVSETVDALRVCVNYKAKSFTTAPRVTEEIDLYPWDIEERIRAGIFIDQYYDQNNDASQDEDHPTTFLEQHRRYDLDDDGYAEPYIVTISRDGGKLARIVAAYDEDTVHFSSSDHRIRKIDAIGYYTKFGFIPSPDGSVYDIGFGNLLYPLNEAINSTLNQMFDAGHLQNAGGGFIGSGMSMNTGSVTFRIGEYKIINSPGMAIRENLVPLNFPGPNPVLFQLLQFLVESAREVASIKDILTGDLPGANTPGILGLATIQQGLKVFSSIFKRIHRSLKEEFTKLYRLNRVYLDEQVDYNIGEELFYITRTDYQKGSGVRPVSDPESVTDLQQMARANFMLQFMNDPWCDGRKIRVRAFEAANIDQIDDLILQHPATDPNAAATELLGQVEQAKVHLRDIELQIRAQRESKEAARAETKDKATEIRDLTQAILNLANARKADAEVDQNWIDLQIQHFKAQIDALATPETGPTYTGAGQGAPDVGGPVGAGVPGLAPPPGVSPPPQLPG